MILKVANVCFCTAFTAANMDNCWVNIQSLLKSADTVQRQEALVQIKDQVIGSNRQKGNLLSNGLLCDILKICTGKDANLEERLHAFVIVGSLSKGSYAQVKLLVQKFDVVPMLVNEVLTNRTDKKCVEVCLFTLRSIYEHPFAPPDAFLVDDAVLPYLLSLATAENSIKSQICVTSILVSLCQTHEDQNRLLHAGTIHVLSRMICAENEEIKISALRCLACMSYANRSVTDNMCVTSYQGKSLPDILETLLSRLYKPEIQITAARCLTYLYRSGTLLSTDFRIVHRTLPSLARLCSDHFRESIRTLAAETLAYLLEINSDLQRIASISHDLIKSLYDLLQSRQPLTRKAALKCFASLGANDESIRKKVMESHMLVDSILDGLNDRHPQVRLASVRCLHSFSRSVQQLRTSLQDSTVWKPIMQIISFESTVEFLIAVTCTVCNLLLEFSPSKEPMIYAGIIKKLCQLTEHANATLRLNSVWALMNMSFQSDQRVKMDIINTLGVERVFILLNESNSAIVMKTLGLLRNLLSKSDHIEFLMSTHRTQFMEAMLKLLNSEHTADVKEQVLCIVGNIATEAKEIDYIFEDERMMLRLADLLRHPDNKIQTAVLTVIHNTTLRRDTWCEEKYLRLKSLEIATTISEMKNNADRNVFFYDDFVVKMLKSIINKFNIVRQDNERK